MEVIEYRMEEMRIEYENELKAEFCIDNPDHEDCDCEEEDD